MLRPSRRLLRLLPFALLLALSSCAGSLLSRAREAERTGAHYEAEQLYKELYKSTPTRERQRRGLYSLRAAEAAYRGRRYATARALLQRAQRLHLPDSLLRKSKLYTTLSTAALRAEDSSPQGAYEVERFDRLRSTRSEFGVSFTPDGRTLLFGSPARQRSPSARLPSRASLSDASTASASRPMARGSAPPTASRALPKRRQSSAHRA